MITGESLMSTTAAFVPAHATTHGAVSSTPPLPHLTAAQRRELESDLRRELAALDRRLESERQADSTELHAVDANDVAVALRGASDTAVRRDLVASALARIASGSYGECSHCGEPIAYGRLVVMPETSHCLMCSGRP
jgi:DnaK suppressor protein